MTEHSKEISSVQLAKNIGVTQKTAWHMIHRIHNAAKLIDSEMFLGEVEVDKTYFGGKECNKHKDKRMPETQGTEPGKTKTVASGIRERHGAISRARRS